MSIFLGEDQLTELLTLARQYRDTGKIPERPGRTLKPTKPPRPTAEQVRDNLLRLLEKPKSGETVNREDAETAAEQIRFLSFSDSRPLLTNLGINEKILTRDRMRERIVQLILSIQASRLRADT